MGGAWVLGLRVEGQGQSLDEVGWGNAVPVQGERREEAGLGRVGLDSAVGFDVDGR